MDRETKSTVDSRNSRAWDRAIQKNFSNSITGVGIYLLIETPQELRLKTIRLIGRQNLQLYKNWKGSEEDIKREYERNKAIGLKFGCWKNNCLVYDDDGKVLNELKVFEFITVGKQKAEN